MSEPISTTARLSKADINSHSSIMGAPQLPAKPEEGVLRMPSISKLFQSSDSATRLLMEEALKSNVSIELPLETAENTNLSKEATEAGSHPPPAVAAATPAIPPPAAVATRTDSSTLLKWASGVKETVRSAISGVLSSKEWAQDISRHEPVDVNAVFASSKNEDLSPAKALLAMSASTPAAKKRKKTDWNAVMMQDMNVTAPVRAGVAPGPSKKKQVVPTKQRKRSKPKRPKKAVDNSARVHVNPNDLDVLLGRGGRTNNHPGNKRYLEVKDAIQTRYMAASKEGKTPISQELVDLVHAWGGRFLKLDSDGGEDDHLLWYEVDNTTARKKCSQTLREINTAEVREAKRARYRK